MVLNAKREDPPKVSFAALDISPIVKSPNHSKGPKFVSQSRALSISERLLDAVEQSRILGARAEFAEQARIL